MSPIRQFKPVLYAVSLLGTLGFTVAAETPGIMLLGTFGVILNAMLVYLGWFRPMPRLLANIVTIGVAIYMGATIFGSGVTLVLVIGQFIVLLLLIKLWEQRGNRDYAQILVLSLLLMVAAAISTSSLLFFAMLLVHLVLAMYCRLLFHLKLEIEAARTAGAVPHEADDASLADGRRFGRSLRNISSVLAWSGIVMAAIVFAFFPRGPAGPLVPLQLSGRTLTGFSDQVSFQKIAQITQNNEIVAYVRVWRNGSLDEGVSTLMLRGTVLDYYTGASERAPWQWVRRTQNRPVESDRLTRDVQHTISSTPSPLGEEWRQQFTFRAPTGTSTLFAIGGPMSFTARRDIDLFVSRSDGVLQSPQARNTPFDYEVISNGNVGAIDPRYDQPPSRTPRWDPRIQDYALRPEVSGSDEEGPLAERRPAGVLVHALDARIAENIESHLRDTFSYTMDLSDARKIMRGQDPLVAFLYDTKRGHCEYFAGAMALMCQSLGMQARLVTGFKCDEYNEFGQSYVVKQSHAHAWVEVKTTEGWRTFDPTAARETIQRTSTGGVFTHVRDLFNYLDFVYAAHIVAYDGDSQTKFINNVDGAITSALSQPLAKIGRFGDWLNEQSAMMQMMPAVFALVLIAVAARLIWRRRALRRRAKRIGLDALPLSDQLRLSRQLRFYDDLLLLLAQRGIARRPQQTPQEFARSLSFLPPGAYEMINRLTRVFYRVRFGRSGLHEIQHQRLVRAVSDLKVHLPARPQPAHIGPPA